MVQEHERAAGGWQAEWPLVHGIVQSAGVALESMVEVLEGLIVDRDRMRSNIESTNGAVFAEKAVNVLSPELGNAAAREKVDEMLRKSGGLRDLAGVNKPEEYLGSAEAFRRRLLEGGS